MVGRPTDYSESMVDSVYEYIEQANVPSVAGLSLWLKCSKSSIYVWGDKYPEFMETLNALQATQESKLLDKGLDGTWNSAIAKLMLSNHGYSEKSQTAITGADGGAVETLTRTIVEPRPTDS